MEILSQQSASFVYLFARGPRHSRSRDVLNRRLVCRQVDEVNFSLSHPNQYFIESQKILGGGKDLKREADVAQRSQEAAPPRGAQAPAANATGELAEMTEDLDSFFQDG